MDEEKTYCNEEIKTALNNVSNLVELLSSNTELRNSKTGQFVSVEIQLNRVHCLYYTKLREFDPTNKTYITLLLKIAEKLLNTISELENLYEEGMCKNDKLEELQKRREIYSNQIEFLNITKSKLED